MFLDIYDRIVIEDKLSNEKLKKYFLSDKKNTENLKRCRFCGKTEKETKFDKSSHTISAMIGNKHLFSEYECVKCNKAFGCSCEDSFGKYVLPFKMISEVFGRKKTMCHSEEFGEIRMNNSDPIMPDFNKNIKNLIKETKKNELVTMTDDGFELKVKRKRYTPEWVYFALLKMALGIIPYELIPRYAYTYATLFVVVKDESERKAIFDSYVTPGFIEFIYGNKCFAEVSVELFKRKSTASNEYPLCYFCLNFGRFSIQIPLPEDAQRNGEGMKACSYKHFPNSVIEPKNFHEIEEIFKCEFLADKKELSIEEIEKIRNIIF